MAQCGVPFVFPTTISEIVDEQEVRVFESFPAIATNAGQGTHREGRRVAQGILDVAGAETGGISGQGV